VRKCSSNTDPLRKNRLSLCRAVSLCTRPNFARPIATDANALGN
jgi:hypothetical protein